MILTFVTSIFWGERIELDVALPSEQVLARIAERNEGSWIERLFSPGIAVSIGENSFKLSKMGIGNIPMSGNSFVHVLSGKIIKTSTGSKVIA